MAVTDESKLAKHVVGGSDPPRDDVVNRISRHLWCLGYVRVKGLHTVVDSAL